MSADHQGYVSTDLPCVQCDYNPRFQPESGVCPECGRPVRQTMDFPRISRSAPRWITSLIDSVNVLLVAAAVAIALNLFGARRGAVMTLCLGVVPWALCWFAVWLLTRPEPGRRSWREDVRRWLLRALATLPYIAFYIDGVVAHSWRTRSSNPLAWTMLMLLVSAAPATILYYLPLRRAALRLPSRALAWQAGIVAWGLGLSIAVTTILLFQVHPMRWLLSGIIYMPPLPVLGSLHEAVMFLSTFLSGEDIFHWIPLSRLPQALFVPWAVALLIQFRIGFGRAARAARSARGACS